ncbi:MAG: lactate utilization protein [Desulfobacteraceae bacterium]|nr:lactate utilization protein [Desulfobacteraceae bacterium]
MQDKQDLTKLFEKQARKVSAVVERVADFQEAFVYTADLCSDKQACELLAPGCEAALSEKGQNLCSHKPPKIIAAPGLDGQAADKLNRICRQKGIKLLTKGLRGYLAGIDAGFTFADYGIAETGTLVMNAGSEEIRLATMISEIHVAVLPVTGLVATAADLEDELESMFGKTPNYTAFITGASRSGDIEQVLALGVHGPLELHILLMESNSCKTPVI